jgi:hypothetical protein
MSHTNQILNAPSSSCLDLQVEQTIDIIGASKVLRAVISDPYILVTTEDFAAQLFIIESTTRAIQPIDLPMNYTVRRMIFQ